MDPELKTLLETFWTEHPIWPGSQAGPSEARGVETDDQLLSLHRLLGAVDPKEAGRWHWRDGRKVRRGLERWWERGSAEGTKAQQVGGGRRAR
jgi:tRNA A37 N6-isopentenylltransferase MiaA